MTNDRIRERIRQLRDKTTARGCTEAEAMAAAAKAAQLMRDYDLSDADLEFIERSSASRQKGGGQKAKLWGAIAWCTNTATIVISDRDGTRVTFVGREPGPEIAVYLRDVCERAIDRELRLFKQSKLYRRQRKLSSKRETAAAFASAMVYRLAARLRKIFRPTRDEEAQKLAATARDERYTSSTQLATPRAPLGRLDAMIAGAAAGEKVPLAHGVGGGSQPLAIGGGS